ncbi:MAG: YicC family protein [Spirochaetaceae bacterium]|nr:YicC family protein [Spirochaetaceae bacterium]
MNSMTGFGYSEGEGAGVHMSVEIKSLNTRYLDMIVSTPPSLSVLEGRIREKLQGSFIRGRLEVTVRIRDIEENMTVSVDNAAAEAWKTAFDNLSRVLEGEQKVSLEMLVQQDGVLKVSRERDSGAYWNILESLISDSTVQVLGMREKEGVELARDIESQLAVIESSLKKIKKWAPEVQREVEESLRSRFLEILGDDTGEQRIMVETAAWIVKTDINEEIVRLETHLGAFREDSAVKGAKGKKLDFLAQEMGREINTIGSKSPKAEVSREVVNMKDALEKVREQLRNVE